MGMDAEVLQAVNPMNKEEKNDFARKVGRLSSISAHL